MGIEENKAVIARWIDEVENGRRLDLIDELVAEDYVDHGPMDGWTGDRSGLHGFFTTLHSAFPDIRTEILHMVAEGSTVMILKRCRGTHDGPFRGIPPTGKPMVIDIANVFTVADGRITAHWHALDQMAIPKQLGLLPLHELGR